MFLGILRDVSERDLGLVKSRRWRKLSCIGLLNCQSPKHSISSNILTSVVGPLYTVSSGPFEETLPLRCAVSVGSQDFYCFAVSG